jgi:hypothetical protein
MHLIAYVMSQGKERIYLKNENHTISNPKAVKVLYNVM